jgi:hypothetical protein
MKVRDIKAWLDHHGDLLTDTADVFLLVDGKLRAAGQCVVTLTASDIAGGEQLVNRGASMILSERGSPV